MISLERQATVFSVFPIQMHLLGETLKIDRYHVFSSLNSQSFVHILLCFMEESEPVLRCDALSFL